MPVLASVVAVSNRLVTRVPVGDPASVGTIGGRVNICRVPLYSSVHSWGWMWQGCDYPGLPLQAVGIGGTHSCLSR